jgi:hypothetical protein
MTIFVYAVAFAFKANRTCWMFGNAKTYFTVHEGPIQSLFKLHVCGKQLKAAFPHPADSIIHSPLFAWTVKSLSTVLAGPGPVQS